MKTVYIKEEQKKMIENAITEKDGVRKTLLNEENSTDRKKVEKIISEFCYRGIVPYLLRPVTECEPVRSQAGHTGTFQKVAANEHGFNRLIDYLRINLYEQFGMTRDNGPAKYRIGIARIACEDLGFYSFGQNLQGGKLIKFGKLMKLFAYKPELMFNDGVGPDKNLNGMTYDELMDEYGPKMDAYVSRQKSELDRDAASGLRHDALRDESLREINTPPEVYRCGNYKIYHINDTVNNYSLVPNYSSKIFLDRLGEYADWCICGDMGQYEYAQYMGNGGNLYIMLKDGFKNIPKMQGENCPLDEYGLSMIAVIVGTDGLPDNVTTRWNHDFGGENHSSLWEAIQIQKLTGVKYSSIFKPRSQEQLRQMYLAEDAKKPSAMDQVHNKVNAGVMDAVTCGGMMEEEFLSENSNDRKVNKYISEKFGLTNFQDIRNKVMEIYEKIPYSRICGGRYMLGVLRLLFEENLPKKEYGVLNKILYKIGNSNYYERQWVNDGNLGGWSFEQLKEKYFVPDFEGDKFSTVEKIVKLPNGYTITRIDSYDEMNARCDGEWCISYDENMWNELTEGETVYLVENEELINKFDEAMEDPKYSNKFDDIAYVAGEEDDMRDMALINSRLEWTNKLGSWKFPYDIYGLSRFVVLVGKEYLTVYSRYNMPNEFDGDYLTKEQLEQLLGVNFTDVFKYVPVDKSYGHYDNYGRWRVDAAPAVTEGAEPEADEYKIGGEGGNNEYFHAMNESKIGNFDFKKYFKPIAEFMREDGLNVYPYPKIRLNWEPQDGLFIKTGYYEPETKTIVIFCDDRHPKDILRTFCHEMIHHSQNLDGVNLNFSSADDVKDNERLEEIESEAYLKGNVYFRKWTEYAKKDSKDVLQEGRKKVVKNDEGEIVPEKCDKCGGDVVCQIHGEPVYICKECGKYFGTVPFNLDESIDIHKALAALRKRRDPANIENWDTINEDTDPGDIDLSSFDIKTALNPKFWKDEHLDSRIRIRLLDIADDFIEFLGVNWVKPEDVIMTGSLANYNWNKKYSDIDLHILMDFSKVDKRTDFVKDYFDSKKNLWNESHKGLSICGFPVELYVQDSNEKHSSTGVYSLNKNEWITEPNRASLKNSKINKALIKNKVSEFMDKIDKIDDIYKSAGNDSYKARKASEMAEKLWAEIKAQRKEGLSDAKNEITNGNIIYKTLRRTGYLDKIFSLRDKSYDKVNSLDESQD